MNSGGSYAMGSDINMLPSELELSKGAHLNFQDYSVNILKL